MEKSTSIKAIAGAIKAFQSKMGKLPKDTTNPFFKSKYCALPTILDAIQLPLAESGLSFVQFPDGDNQLTTILMHSESGEYLQATYSMHPTKTDPQGIGSAITYARRYALGAILGLNIDEDDDGNAASKPTEQVKETAPIIDENQLPWLTEGQFKKAIDRIAGGEQGVITNLKRAFRVKKDYMTKLQEAEQLLIA